MSAVPIQQLAEPTEADLLCLIGRIATEANSAAGGFREIVDSALIFPGVYSLKIEGGELFRLFGQFVSSGVVKTSHSHTVSADVEANGRAWGQLALEIDSAPKLAEVAERFGRFIGQQLALLLNRVDLVRECGVRRTQAKRLSEKLEARKNLHRASGSVARTRGVSNQHALQLLVRHARKAKRTLNSVAETVLLGYEAPFKQRPTLRRLAPGERTPSFTLRKTIAR